MKSLSIDTRKSHASGSHSTEMRYPLSTLFAGTGWNPLVNGFKKCKKGTITRFVFVANSVNFGDSPNPSILRDIFSEYGPLHDVFVVEDKPFANIAFVHIGDAITALYTLNGQQHPALNRKLHLDFSEPRYPKQFVDVVPDFVRLTKDVPLPKGLILIEDYLTTKEEDQLLQCIDNDDVKWADNFSRRVKHYGFEFDYDTLSIAFDKALDNIPKPLLEILPHHKLSTSKSPKIPKWSPDELGDTQSERDRVLKYCSQIDQCTVNEYHKGQGIRPHIEATECFGEYVVSMSLLSPIVMDFRHKTTNIKKSIILPPRSLLIIGSEARYDWSHGISHRKYDVIEGALTERQRRVSLTFRQVIKPSNGYTVNPLRAPEIERNHVHSVYERIAPHFSNTRHSGWPQVVAFLRRVSEEFAFPMVADIGCGNGKYLNIIRSDPVLSRKVEGIGMDRSENLCKIVSNRRCAVFVSDALLIPFANESFECVLNIAVLHHISERKRRQRLMSELFRITKIGGRGFICAWAYEQDGSSRHKFEKSDVFVPWNLSKKKCERKQEDDEEGMILQRYCHVYKEGELEELVADIANIVDENGKLESDRDSRKIYEIEIARSFYNKGNWCIEYRRH